MKRHEQMMEAAEAYAAGCYADEPVSFSTEENICETINDFCAGWRAADRLPHWIPVDERLPKERGQYFVYTAAGQSWQSEWMQDFKGVWRWYASPVVLGIIANVTHWMEIVPPKEGGDHDK